MGSAEEPVAMVVPFSLVLANSFRWTSTSLKILCLKCWLVIGESAKLNCSLLVTLKLKCVEVDQLLGSRGTRTEGHSKAYLEYYHDTQR